MKMEAVRADPMEQRKHGLSPRGARRPSFMKYPSLPMRGCREDRMPVAPVECVRKMTTGSTGATRRSLRDWFTAYTCSPRRAGLSSRRRLPGQRPCKLDPSVGQRRGIGTTRFCRPPRPCSSVTASASIASRLNVRDDASAPLGRAGMTHSKSYYSENRKKDIFARTA
jgi:hypothetical protein